MTYTQRDAMQQALDALTEFTVNMTLGQRYTNVGQMALDALPLLREALAEPTVEPVAYHYKYLNHIGEEVWSLYPPLLAQVLETQALYTSPTPPATYQRIGTLYSNSWPMAASGWGFVPNGMACCMAGYSIEKAVFVQDEVK